jgi:ribosomal protein S18 acetylase RimI-like enzyme
MRPPGALRKAGQVGEEWVVEQAAGEQDRNDAVAVWQAANTARGMAPSWDRTARVKEKLSAPDALIAVARSGGEVVAMALGETGRAEDGEGPVEPGFGHISMVFVHPALWGRGIGGQLLDWLHREMFELGWYLISLWTRDINERALRLYESRDYVPTGRSQQLPDGSRTVQLERRQSR